MEGKRLKEEVVYPGLCCVIYFCFSNAMNFLFAFGCICLIIKGLQLERQTSWDKFKS